MYLFNGLGRHIFGGTSMIYKEANVPRQLEVWIPVNTHSICEVLAQRLVHPSDVVCVTMLDGFFLNTADMRSIRE